MISPATCVIRNGRDAGNLVQAGKTLRDEGLAVLGRSFDVTDASQVDTPVAAIELEAAPIALLVNKAGMQRRAPLHEFPRDLWSELMQIAFGARA